MTRRVTALPSSVADLADLHELSGAVVERLDKYLDLLVKWGKRINLTGTTDRTELIRFHLHDCLHVVPHLIDGALVDVGAGAGLPSMVLACRDPERPITAVEPTNKKVAFLRTVKRELGLAAVEVQAVRVEKLEAHTFDIAISRATWSLDRWFEIGEQLVRPGGVLVGMEGRERFELEGVARHPYQLGNRQRAIVVRRVS